MSEILSSKSYPGTRDFYPKEMRYRQLMFSLISEAVESFSYERISAPLLESFDIFAAKSGEEIAEKQLYVFEDKGARKVAIRPEFTPSLARMFAAKIHDLPSIQRWFSIENFMRYERPQQGRLREFYQINVDLIGATGVFADFEIFRVAKSIFDICGASNEMYEIRVNHKGFLEDVLLNFLGLKNDLLEFVFKIFDKKHKISSEEFNNSLYDIGLSSTQIIKLNEFFALNFKDMIHLFPESLVANELKDLFILADEVFASHNPLVYDFSIVRGLAYYTGIVFEAYDKVGGARALFGGGRYDNLISLFNKKSSVSGVGFAIGDVTFEMFLKNHNLLLQNDLLEEKHLVAIDKNLPLVSFHKIRDCLLQMQSVLQDCMSMCLDIRQIANNSCSQEFTQIWNLLDKNPFFDKDLFSRNNIEEFFAQHKKKKYSIEIYPDPKLMLGKQLQYANKAGISYVWICGIPEMKRGILKRKNMDTGVEKDFSLATFESL